MKPLLIASAAIAVCAFATAWWMLRSEPVRSVIPVSVPNNAGLPSNAVPPSATESRGDILAVSKLTPSAMFRDLMKTGTVGDYRGGNAEYWDFCLPGAVLAGFEYSLLAAGAQDQIIASLRPIFRSSRGDQAGLVHGQPAASPDMIVARPGFAVGAIEARGTDVVHGFRLTFMRLNGDRLDPAESYRSDWIGGEGSKGLLLDGETSPFIGVGTRSRGCVHSLTLFTRKDDANHGYPGIPSRAAPDTTLPLPDAGAEEFTVRVRGDDHYELYLNGVLVLAGDDWQSFHVRRLPLAPGDVLAASVRDDQGGTRGGFSLDVLRHGKAVLGLEHLRCTAWPREDWATNPDLSGWRAPQLVESELAGSGESKTKTRAAWSADAAKAGGRLFFKVVVP